MGEVPVWGGEGGFTLSVGFAASSPRGGAKRERIATPVCGLVRNDILFLTCFFYTNLPHPLECRSRWGSLLVLLVIFRKKSNGWEPRH